MDNHLMQWLFLWTSVGSSSVVALLYILRMHKPNTGQERNPKEGK
jgi:hypothetical protein